MSENVIEIGGDAEHYKKVISCERRTDIGSDVYEVIPDCGHKVLMNHHTKPTRVLCSVCKFESLVKETMGRYPEWFDRNAF